MDVRECLQMALEHEGYDVTSASNGAEAMSQLRAMSAPPDVVVCDLMMPVMTGWELCSKMAQDPTFARIPVITVSAVTGRSGLPPIPGNVIFSKPVDIDKLLDAIASFCGQAPLSSVPSSESRR